MASWLRFWARVNEVIPDPLDGERIDRVISMLLGLSRSAAANAVDAGLVQVDSVVVAKPSQRVSTGQVVVVEDSVLDPEEELAPDPTVELNLVHVDDDVLVVDKAVGQVVHPGAGHTSGTIAQGVLAQFPEVRDVGDPARPGIVHRLDKGTSGVFMIARTEEAYDSLTEQLRDRTVSRRYLTLGWGRPRTPRGVIEAPIGRAVRDPTRMVVREDGKPARTSYSVVSSWSEPKLSLFSCELDTGRTHQIRVHLEAIHHPVVGDQRYGGGRDLLGLERPALHAAELGFTHPTTGDRLSFSSPMPPDMAALIDSFGKPDEGEVK